MIQLEFIQQINLSGVWRFTPERGSQTTIQVPGGGWLKQGFTCEAGTYETDITIPASATLQVVRLELGAVNHLAEYWLGPDAAHLQKIHEEVTAFTPQIVDLTPYVSPGLPYILQIKVRAWQNGRPIAPHWAEWCECIARGIFRSAYLQLLPVVFIEDLWVSTSVINQSATILATIVNADVQPHSVTLQGDFQPWNSDTNWPYSEIPPLQVRLAPGEHKSICLPVDWTAGPESFWWPNVPYQAGFQAQLHWANIALYEESEKVHSACVRFGFRELRQMGNRYELNGIPVNFRGDNLQVANYDRIDFHGKGDAIDTLPGFLPPSESCAGWPQAVDNFQRLHYNVQREHMGPWTPYMLDVCDEMGLMLIGESACRWDGFDMENGRGFHEVKCLQDIIQRDRHHPSIVRWSTKNEAQCIDPAYHLELYSAIKALDNTRPISEDIVWFDRAHFDVNAVFHELLHKPDFTWIDHYLTYNASGEPFFTTIQQSDAIIPMRERPFGMGEADWARSSTPAGLPWFAATIALARAQGAADVRPYVLLSSWASSIPGVKHTDFITEENRHPVYGEDNLPDPWSHPGIRLLQQACHPLLALDIEFWQRNRHSDAHGHFPVIAPIFTAGTTVTRVITLFNDDLDRDDTLQLYWEVKEGSPSNRCRQHGQQTVHVPIGTSAPIEITFTAPIFNTFIFLYLQVSKAGQIRFEDTLTCYEIVAGEDFRSEFNGEERKFL